ncbi:MAG TPA: tetratricopeptide repeat protein [Planctomycetaceae bacterium]|jgi:predicted TPR repeat methyltransferase
MSTDQPPPPTAEPPLQAVTMKLTDAINIGRTLHRRGLFPEAENVYRQILSVAPDQPEALHFLGVLFHQAGRHEDALKLIRASLEIDPAYADAHNNLGNVLKEQSQTQAAEAAYRRAIELKPDFADAHNNLAAVLSDQERYEEAVVECRRAIELSPEMAEPRVVLGSALAEQGQHADAVDEFLRAMAVKRFRAGATENMAFSLLKLGRNDEAAAMYRRWLAIEPDNPRPRHHLAGCTGQDVPPRCPDDYVRTVFDRFSKTFDVKLRDLKYCAPALVVDALAAEIGPPQAQLDILDAGCGTGLCAAGIRPFARCLEGVDLSPGMLAKAGERGGYDELHEAELSEFMRQAPLSYDAIISADTLIYFGDLRQVIVAAAGALRPAARLVFTVELAEPAVAIEGFRLDSHGRYSHTADHVRTALVEAGLEVRRLEEVFLRMEGGQAVQGWLVVGRRPDAGNS